MPTSTRIARTQARKKLAALMQRAKAAEQTVYKVTQVIARAETVPSTMPPRLVADLHAAVREFRSVIDDLL